MEFSSILLWQARQSTSKDEVLGFFMRFDFSRVYAVMMGFAAALPGTSRGTNGAAEDARSCMKRLTGRGSASRGGWAGRRALTTTRTRSLWRTPITKKPTGALPRPPAGDAFLKKTPPRPRKKLHREGPGGAARACETGMALKGWL